MVASDKRGRERFLVSFILNVNNNSSKDNRWRLMLVMVPLRINR